MRHRRARMGGLRIAARRAAGIWLAGLLAGVAMPDPSPAADERRPPAVLILLPGQPTGTQTSIDSFAAAARTRLVEALPAGSTVYLEYTDLARLGTAAEQAKLRDWYKVKYAAPIDLIIAGGQEPRSFLIRFRPELWPWVPVVFGAMDARTLQRMALPAGTTALTTRYDEEGTIRAALALLPDTEQVALVSGASNLDRYLRDLWVEALGRFGTRPQLIDLAGLPLDDLKARLAALPPHTVALFSSVFADATGRAFVIPEVLPELAAVSNRPMFTIHGPMLGLGVVGGSMADYASLGTQTGELGARILKGAPLPPEPIEATEVNRLRFDWRALRRWGLDERRLPAGSAVLYRSPSAWELYRGPIVIGLSVLLAQALLIAALLVQRAQRRRVQRALDERLRFETFLADLSRSFVDSAGGQIDDSIRQGLRRIGEFLALDRVTLFELTHRRGRAQVIYAWATTGTSPLPAEMAAEAFPWMSRQLARGEAVTFVRPEDLPPEAAADTATFVAHGTRSHASIPLVEDGITRRVLAFSTVRDERTWPEPVVRQLGLIVEVLGQILARREAKAEVKLEYLGLAAAARGVCAELGAAHDIAITFSERDIPGTLPPEVAACVYRVLQEVLSNVVKHSRSARAEVELTGADSSVRLRVRDFGMGMTPHATQNRPGLGLTSIRERLRSVNGTLTVESAFAAGTELVVRIPLAPAPPSRAVRTESRTV